jgi:hypothetical protein
MTLENFLRSGNFGNVSEIGRIILKWIL